MMRRLPIILRWSSLCVLSLAVVGCAGAGSQESDLTEDAGAAPSLSEQGRSYVNRYGCASCHDPGDQSFSGQGTAVAGTGAFGSNLTPDDNTGLGSWSDADIARAIRRGVDDTQIRLCPTMPRFTQIDDAQMEAIIAFLRSLSPVENSPPDSTCAPFKVRDGEEEDAGAVVNRADAGVLPRDGRPDMRVPLPDMVVSESADMTPAKFPRVDACHLLINEVQTGALVDTTDEFVEVFNPCPTAIDLTGVVLVYRAAAGTRNHPLIHLTGTLPANRYFVCGGPTYSGVSNASYRGISMAEQGGAVALLDATDAILDSVGFGTATNSFVQGIAAAAPPRAASLTRLPDGADTHDNGRDFSVTRRPTPGGKNH